MIINGKPIHRIYISGAITGKKNFKKSFEAAEKAITAKGFTALSPIKTQAHIYNMSERSCMFDALKLMEEADAVLQISDIKKSKGMQIEQAIAEKCGIPFVTLEDLK